MGAQLELEWASEYAMGHRQIDEQHRRLFELYNIIVEGFVSGLGAKILEPALGELLDYTRTHFATEERLMAQLGFDGLARHRRSHQRFAREVEHLYRDFCDGQPVLLYELLGLMQRLLSEHLLTEDAKLREALSSWRSAAVVNG